MLPILEYLHSPELAASFQKLCGIEIVVDDNSTNEDFRNGTGHNNHKLSNGTATKIVENGRHIQENGFHNNTNGLHTQENGNGIHVQTNGNIQENGTRTHTELNKNETNNHNNGGPHIHKAAQITSNGTTLHDRTNGTIATSNGSTHSSTQNGNCNQVKNGSIYTGEEANGLRKRTAKNDFWSDPIGEYNPEMTAAKTETHKEGYTFKCTNKLLDYWFHFGACLGNEVFYITFIPFLIWNVDFFVARRMCIFWATYMYLGQATKDIVKWPRPAAPPVARLEDRYALEFGMPSTHAMVGAGMPFSIFILTVNRYEYPWQLGLAICIFWCSTVCLSRIYLGMHSVLDVLVGLLYVFSLMPIYFSLVDILDDFILHHEYSPIVCLLVPFFVCAIYPSPEKWSTARGDTTMIVAVSAGAAIGSWYGLRFGMLHPSSVLPPYQLPAFTAELVLYSAARLVFGVILMMIIRTLCKKGVFGSLCWGLHLNKDDLKDRQRLSVELPIKFVTYASLGLAATIVIPFAFDLVGIGKKSYFHELY